MVTSTYASTSIEGNPLALTEVKRVLKTQPAHIRQSEQEVINYNRTLLELNLASDAPFTIEQILAIHRGVTLDLLPAEHSAHWRLEPVVIHEPRSGNVLYLPPDHQDVPGLMGRLRELLRSGGSVGFHHLARIFRRRDSRRTAPP